MRLSTSPPKSKAATGCQQQEETRADAKADFLHRLRDAAPGRVRLAAAMLYRGDDRARLARRAALARQAGVPLIAVNDVLYHHPDRRELQDVLTCIREHLTIDTAGRRLAVNAERFLKSPDEMARHLPRCAGGDRGNARARPRRSPSRSTNCNTNIPTRPSRASPRRRRRSSISPWQGARERYPDGIDDAVRKSLATSSR